MVALKKDLIEHCERWIEGRIRALKEALNQIQSDANEETKSSAGDKYETGRAMAQLEVEKLSLQLTNALNIKRAIKDINIEQKTVATIGSLVDTSANFYFISVSAGLIKINDYQIYAISPNSPAGAALLQRTIGDEITIAGKKSTIKNIY